MGIKKKKEGELLPTEIPLAMGSSACREPNLGCVLCTQGCGTPAVPSLLGFPSLPGQGSVGWGAWGALFSWGEVGSWAASLFSLLARAML